MSAFEIPQVERGYDWAATGLHIAALGETSANFRRKAHARQVARARRLGFIRIHAGLGSIVVVVTAAYLAMIQAFMAFSNAPIP